MSYVRFYSDATFTLGTNGNVKLWNGTATNAMEYSTDASTWTSWDGTTAISSNSTAVSGKYNLYLRGTGNTKISNSTSRTVSTKFIFTGTQSIDSEGNIESLLDYQTVDNNQHPTVATYAFACLFDNQTLLKTSPELGSTTLTNYCYYNMFRGCTSLTISPALPATTLATNCYESMFRECTSLAIAPVLPVTTLANDCYSFIFYGCTSLTTAPELPATTLANYCYSNMFYGCTALTAAPELPATTLANYCYSNMFYGCTSLTIPPELLAVTLTTYCYYNMFKGCTSLAIAPELPATILAEGCYNAMFYGTNIKLSTTQHDDYTLAYRIPAEGTGTTATNALTNMFYGSGVNTPSINTTYYVKDKQYMVTESEITAIADAIRLSSNSNSSLTYPDDFIDEIEKMGKAFCYSKDSIPDDDFGNNGDLCIIS